MTDHPAPKTETLLPEVSEDDPHILIAARAIAEHGMGRPWDDFLPVNAHDIDQGDLIEYGMAAIAALRAAPDQCDPKPECSCDLATGECQGPVGCARNRGHGPAGEYCKQHAKRYPAVLLQERT